jgi:hypothetical protein
MGCSIPLTAREGARSRARRSIRKNRQFLDIARLDLILFFRRPRSAGFALFPGGCSARASAVKRRETTRKWRRKPLKSPEMDSAMASRQFAAAGKENRSSEFRLKSVGRALHAPLLSGTPRARSPTRRRRERVCLRADGALAYPPPGLRDSPQPTSGRRVP